jgi:SM-20-related protein
VAHSSEMDHFVAGLRAMPPEALFSSLTSACARLIHAAPPVDEPVRFSLFEEFLAPEELHELRQYVLAQEERFRASQVIAHDGDNSRTDYEHRRSRVLFEGGEFQDRITARLRSYFPQILRSLGHRPFVITSIEAQITASNDGEFFRAHNDNTHPRLAPREVTYVYFFHREPKPFEGGELRLYDSRFQNGRYVAGSGRCVSIEPRQNMVVFFPSHFMHEVTTVHCASGAFADSRFTMNGWIHG